MNRRSFLGIFPMAIAGVAGGVTFSKTTWGENIHAILKAFTAVDEARVFFNNPKLKG